MGLTSGLKLIPITCKHYLKLLIGNMICSLRSLSLSLEMTFVDTSSFFKCIITMSLNCWIFKGFCKAFSTSAESE